jgi:hypothetical protein
MGLRPTLRLREQATVPCNYVVSLGVFLFQEIFTQGQFGLGKTLKDYISGNKLFSILNLINFGNISLQIKNLINAVSLHFFCNNFVRIHQTLRVTPAMEADIMASSMSMSHIILFT